MEEQPISEPGTQDLLVRITAKGMNPVDTKVRQRSEEDKVLGWDAYGVVEKTGDSVTGFQAGDKAFYADDMSEQGKLLSTVAGFLDKGALVTTRQQTLKGLSAENIQAQHLKQESGTMMGKQVLVL